MRPLIGFSKTYSTNHITKKPNSDLPIRVFPRLAPFTYIGVLIGSLSRLRFFTIGPMQSKLCLKNSRKNSSTNDLAYLSEEHLFPRQI